jgi:prephenate dehydratase
MTDQSTVKVSFQGERGAFSETAARQLLGARAETIACATFDEMFDAVSNGKTECAVAPIENSLAGSIHKNYDLLMEHNLEIRGETSVRIIHNLIAAESVSLPDIERVYSHPVALAQCEKFLRQHPQIKAVSAYDTAGSVRMIMENGRHNEAAIAGTEAASFYGAKILIEGIEDNPENFTRFLLLAPPESALKIESASGARKTSLVIRIANQPGALFRALAALALRDIDLTKIESRPIEGRPWEYSFYLDFLGDRSEQRVERALDHLSELAESIRVLGSYTGS